jgi:hypothetical protein
MRYDILAQIIADAGLGTKGVDLFLFHMPDNAHGILIRSPLQGIPVNHYLPGFLHAGIQIIIRSASQSAGDSLSKRLSTALTIVNTSYNDPQSGLLAMTVNYIRPRSLPIIYPRDPGNIREWSMYFDCCYVLPT